MNSRDRLIVGLLWIAAAAVIATTIDLTEPTAGGSLARVAIVLLMLFLAVVYLLDPWDVLSVTNE